MRIEKDFYEIKGCHSNALGNYYIEDKHNKLKQLLNSLGFTYTIINYITFCEIFNIEKQLDFIFINILKQMLKDNKIKFIKQILRPGAKAKLLKKIDENYKNNPLITLNQKEVL